MIEHTIANCVIFHVINGLRALRAYEHGDMHTYLKYKYSCTFLIQSIKDMWSCSRIPNIDATIENTRLRSHVWSRGIGVLNSCMCGFYGSPLWETSISRETCICVKSALEDLTSPYCIDDEKNRKARKPLNSILPVL